MVGLGGLEPPTSRLSGVRSNQLSYRPTPRDDAEEIEPARDGGRPPQPSLAPDPVGSEPAQVALTRRARPVLPARPAHSDRLQKREE